MSIDQDKIEIERIDNLVRNFGWEKVSEELTETEIVLTLKKKRSSGAVVYGAGAD